MLDMEWLTQYSLVNHQLAIGQCDPFQTNDHSKSINNVMIDKFVDFTKKKEYIWLN